MGEVEGKFSRIVLAVGREAFSKLRDCRFGVLGLSATGAEVVKILVLTGALHVEVIDSGPITNTDLGTNFFVHPDDIGKNRLDILLPRLRELNGEAEVSGESRSVDDSWIKKFHSVILCQPWPLNEVLQISKICHENQIQFIMAMTVGPCSILFEDFGDFICKSQDGSRPKELNLDQIKAHPNGKATVIIPAPSDRHVHLEQGCVIEFGDVHEIPELKGRRAKIARVSIDEDTKKVNHFEIVFEDTDFRCTFSGECKVKVLEIKLPFEVHHLQISDILHGAVQNGCDAVNPVLNSLRDLSLLICEFLQENGRLPAVGSEDDARSICAKVPDGYRDIANKIILCCGVEYPPNVGILGGAAAQEAMKFVTSTFAPSTGQWFVVDHSEVLRWSNPPAAGKDRYSGITAIIGNDAMAAIRQKTALIVGVGAIGCEYARHAALFGFRKIILIDDDTVEPSNLTRQFLFRDANRGQHKAAVGRDAVLAANPDLGPDNVMAKVARLDGPNVHSVLSGTDNIDIVFSAVDSVKGRLFLEQFCWLRDIPMVNGGMQKTEADSSIVIPGRTSRLGLRNTGQDGQSESGACTLKYTPISPIDVIQWAHNEFVGVFTNGPRAALSLFEKGFDHCDLESQKRGVHFLRGRVTTFEECVQWAFSKFVRIMEYRPELLLQGHPPSDASFWRGKVVPPRISAEFGVRNEAHMTYLSGAVRLKAEVHGIPFSDGDMGRLPEIVGNCVKPEKPLGEKLVDAKILKESFDQLKVGIDANKITVLEFDKDNELHMDFIYGFSTCRAMRYGIPMENYNRLDVMRTVGNIAPTLASTTAVVGGAAFAEVPMIFGGEFSARWRADITLRGLAYRRFGSRWFKGKAAFGPWDLIDVDGSDLLPEVNKRIEDLYEVSVLGWNCESHEVDVRWTGKVADKIEQVLGYRDDFYLVNVLAVRDEDDVDIPPLRVRNV
jgi:ubiquitin-activating enzyme E1